MSEEIWYKDLFQLFTEKNFYQILPLKEMSLEEKLNALFRFFLYLAVIMTLVKTNINYMFIAIFASIISYLIYQFELSTRQRTENFLKQRDLELIDNKVCTRTTVDNPFMNPTIVDIQYNATRPEACDLEKVKEKVDDNFNKRVFKDVNDIWGRNYSAREFYTVPSTTIPNDQGGYAEWLYGTGATCKEGNGFECKRNTYRYTLR